MNVRMQKLQQFFTKSNIYQNNSVQQIDRQKLNLSHEIQKDASIIEENQTPIIRPYQTDFDNDMYLLAKPLIQPLVQLNIVSKPEIHGMSNELHATMDKHIKRSENLLTIKQQQNHFLDQMRQQNKQQQHKEKKNQLKQQSKTVDYNSATQQQQSIKETNQIETPEYNFKLINKRQLPDQTSNIKLPKGIKEIQEIGQTTEDLERVQDIDNFIYQESVKQFNAEKLNFDCILNIALQRVEEQVMSDLVKTMTIVKKRESANFQINECVDVSIEAQPQKQDQYVQMSSKALPNLQITLNGLRLAKNQYFSTDDKQQCKQMIKDHLDNLMLILMQGHPQMGMSQSLEYLLSLNKSELQIPYEGMTKLELLYIFVREYKQYQNLDLKNENLSPMSRTTTKSKRYLKPTQATSMRTIKKK